MCTERFQSACNVFGRQTVNSDTIVPVRNKRKEKMREDWEGAHSFRRSIQSSPSFLPRVISRRCLLTKRLQQARLCCMIRLRWRMSRSSVLKDKSTVSLLYCKNCKESS